MFVLVSTKISPVGIWCQNDVVSMSMRRDHVASPLIRRHFTSSARWVSFVQDKLLEFS